MITTITRAEKRVALHQMAEQLEAIEHRATALGSGFLGYLVAMAHHQANEEASRD